MTKPNKEEMINGLKYINNSTFKGMFNGVEYDGVLISELISTMLISEDFANAILNVLCNEYEEMKGIISSNLITYVQIDTEDNKKYDVNSYLVRKDKVLEFCNYIKMGMNEYLEIFDEAIKEVYKDEIN